MKDDTRHFVASEGDSAEGIQDRDVSSFVNTRIVKLCTIYIPLWGLQDLKLG